MWQGSEHKCMSIACSTLFSANLQLFSLQTRALHAIIWTIKLCSTYVFINLHKPQPIFGLVNSQPLLGQAVSLHSVLCLEWMGPEKRLIKSLVCSLMTWVGNSQVLISRVRSIYHVINLPHCLLLLSGNFHLVCLHTQGIIFPASL